MPTASTIQPATRRRQPESMPRIDLDEATRILRAGGLVGVPTETVYGLAADGLNPVAVAEIFTRKARPHTHPLILHVLDTPDRYGELDSRAHALIDAFWPGPLTLVVRRRAVVPDAVTGGNPTVALRSPSHPMMRALLEAADLPLAAPSANRFGRVSPTTADHVLAEFPELPVLDGGPASVGIESTIVDLSGPIAALLRPGGVSEAGIRTCVGALVVGGSTPAPGTHLAHYAPAARVLLTDTPDALAAELRAAGLRVGVLSASPPDRYAATLYAQLRALDAPGVDIIVAQRCVEDGVGSAVNDRLRRAAAGR